MSRSTVRALTSHKPMTIELMLPDMSCSHCVATVTRTAQRLDPQARVDVDLATHRVVIDSASVAREAFEAALAAEGYPAAADVRSAGSTRR
jgi:copper chaperone CopZ